MDIGTGPRHILQALYTPVIHILLFLVATSGRVIEAIWRTRTATVRKLIVQTPGRKKKNERKDKRLGSGKRSGYISVDSWQESFGSDCWSRTNRAVCFTSDRRFISRWTANFQQSLTSSLHHLHWGFYCLDVTSVFWLSCIFVLHYLSPLDIRAASTWNKTWLAASSHLWAGTLGGLERSRPCSSRCGETERDRIWWEGVLCWSGTSSVDEDSRCRSLPRPSAAVGQERPYTGEC